MTTLKQFKKFDKRFFKWYHPWTGTSPAVFGARLGTQPMRGKKWLAEGRNENFDSDNIHLDSGYNTET